MGYIKKVVFVNDQPLTEKSYKDFYLQELQKNNFEVEYLDLTNVYFNNFNVERYREFKNVICFNAYKEIEEYLTNQNIKTVLFIIMITYRDVKIKLFRLLSKYKCNLGIFARGSLPIVNERNYESILIKISRVLKGNGIQTISKRLSKALLVRWAEFLKLIGMVHPYNYIFSAGKDGYMVIGAGCKTDKKNAKEIKINSFDYDMYLYYKDSESLVDEEYCLFLDEYIPYHPDFKILGLTSINTENYYEKLNVFFSRIEEMTHKPVVIAAHPKALKYRENNYFHGRKIFFGKTCQLCAHASLIMTTASTSSFYAVMYQKRILYLMSDEIKDRCPEVYMSSQCFAKEMNSYMIYFDKDDPIVLPEEIIDASARETILYNYLTSKETENTQSVDIFIDFLKGL
jgi:hypothetical protein